MKRWLMLGGLLMLAAWLPYVVAELHSDPKERRGRVVAESDGSDAPSLAAAGTSGEQLGANSHAEAPVVRDEPQAPVQPDPPPMPPNPRVQAEPSRREAPAAPWHAEPEVMAEETEPAAATPPPPSGPTEVLKHAYETQPRDPLWASDAESTISGMFGAKDMPADMLLGASCRRAVCRLQLNWTSENAAVFLRVHQTIIQEFATDLAISPESGVEGEVSRRVDLYLVRKGYTLADFGK